MSDKDKIKKAIRYMKACINDAKKSFKFQEYKILKKCYRYPLEVLGNDKK